MQAFGFLSKWLSDTQVFFQSNVISCKGQSPLQLHGVKCIAKLLQDLVFRSVLAACRLLASPANGCRTHKCFSILRFYLQGSITSESKYFHKRILQMTKQIYFSLWWMISYTYLYHQKELVLPAPNQIGKMFCIIWSICKVSRTMFLFCHLSWKFWKHDTIHWMWFSIVLWFEYFTQKHNSSHSDQWNEQLELQANNCADRVKICLSDLFDCSALSSNDCWTKLQWGGKEHCCTQTAVNDPCNSRFSWVGASTSICVFMFLYLYLHLYLCFLHADRSQWPLYIRISWVGAPTNIQTSSLFVFVFVILFFYLYF